MDLHCYLCQEQFDTFINVVNHLKNVHKLRENVDLFQCTVRNSKCGKSFEKINSLRKHVKICVPKAESPIVSNQQE